jgi:drug/metabolite transporter (DMT)-like permease
MSRSMNIKKIIGIVLIALGVLFLAVRGFSYTKETHKADLGPIDLSIKEKERVNIPTWVGVVAAVAGVALLILPSRKN